MSVAIERRERRVDQVQRIIYSSGMKRSEFYPNSEVFVFLAIEDDYPTLVRECMKRTEVKISDDTAIGSVSSVIASLMVIFPENEEVEYLINGLIMSLDSITPEMREKRAIQLFGQTHWVGHCFYEALVLGLFQGIVVLHELSESPRAIEENLWPLVIKIACQSFLGRDVFTRQGQFSNLLAAYLKYKAPPFSEAWRVNAMGSTLDRFAESHLYTRNDAFSLGQISRSGSMLICILSEVAQKLFSLYSPNRKLDLVATARRGTPLRT